jgi:cellulose synthase/poly-beta-1,6-N-acetylglucosamine synthase-like glycosyltransferase
LEYFLFFLIFLYTGATLCQILIWGGGFSKLIRGAKKITLLPESTKTTPVSVIVCARNEATHLERHLPLLEAQQYAADFEILVVNDASTDETATLLGYREKQSSRLRVLHLTEKGSPGKKVALEQGVAAARFEWILLTDADCAPDSPYWIRDMMAFAQAPDTEIVVGYAPFLTGSPPFFRYEVAFTALQFSAFALWGFPYMATGRNLAWKKSLFYRHQGFANHRDLASGDDDLFVNAAATPHNLQICLSPNTFMRSPAPPDLRAWWQQKRRHLSAAPRYRPLHQLLLGALAVTHTLHYGLGAILLALSICPEYVATLYGIRLLIAWPVAAQALKQFKEEDLGRFFPWWDGWMAVWYGAGVPFLLWGKRPIHWK